MSREPIVRVNNVSKAYRLWRDPGSRLKAPLCQLAANYLPQATMLHKRLQEKSQSYFKDFYALRDISFEVAKGESVGIIGLNGSGKSTLLQIIAGTLQATAGEVTVHGSVGGLLELGSSFDLEYSGRENIYLAGIISGLARAEVSERFDDIAAFADIGDFIEQPVKTYSSGMLLRLAFAVKTALEPDVLIGDEALAVGDIFFQGKCLRRMRELQERGTGILFVSHALGTVREMCTRGILLNGEELIMDDDCSLVTQRYLRVLVSESQPVLDEPELHLAEESLVEKSTTRSNSASNIDIESGREAFEKRAAADRIQSGKAHFVNVLMLGPDDVLQNSFEFGERVTYRMVIRVDQSVHHLWIGYQVKTNTGVQIVHGDSGLMGRLDYEFRAGRTYIADWRFALNLQHGGYSVSSVLGIPEPPGVMQPSWEYVDVVNLGFEFTVAPRRQGMIGGAVVWDNELSIAELDRP